MKITNLFEQENNYTTVKSNCVYPDGTNKEVEEKVIIEHRVIVIVNDKKIMSLVCTASYLPELVVGRLISEGMIQDVDAIEKINICEFGSRARINLKEGESIDLGDKDNEVSSCCTDNQSLFKTKKIPERITNQKEFRYDEIFKMADSFNSDTKLHKGTFGTHSAYLFYNGDIVFVAEDIGRHNALDKIIGYIYMNKMKPEDCAVFSTGRIPIDMVRKAIYAKLGILVSKAVPTANAIDLAKEYNLKLVCKAWRDSYQIF